GIVIIHKAQVAREVVGFRLQSALISGGRFLLGGVGRLHVVGVFAQVGAVEDPFDILAGVKILGEQGRKRPASRKSDCQRHHGSEQEQCSSFHLVPSFQYTSFSFTAAALRESGRNSEKWGAAPFKKSGFFYFIIK